MNGNMNLGKRVSVLEKDGGADIKKEISDLQNAVTTTQSEIDALETKVNSGVVYSTEERVIGKWIDGKPIYQKTIELGTLSIGPSTIAHNIDNLEMCIYNAASVERPQYGRVMLPIASADANWLALFVGVNSDNMTFDIGRGIGAQLTNAIATIQYTKTTDTPTQ